MFSDSYLFQIDSKLLSRSLVIYLPAHYPTHSYLSRNILNFDLGFSLTSVILLGGFGDPLIGDRSCIIFFVWSRLLSREVFDFLDSLLKMLELLLLLDSGLSWCLRSVLEGEGVIVLRSEVFEDVLESSAALVASAVDARIFRLVVVVVEGDFKVPIVVELRIKDVTPSVML